MTEPQEVLVTAALDVLRVGLSDLRARGWPMSLLVEAVPERDTYAVSLRFELPPMPCRLEPIQPAADEKAEEA